LLVLMARIVPGKSRLDLAQADIPAAEQRLPYDPAAFVSSLPVHQHKSAGDVA
jgi:hypothetical protein